MDVAGEVNRALGAGESVLIEGTQGFGLSLYYGDYPFVTSKDTTASSLCADVGVGPTMVDDVLVVFKAYASRVGEGPMPTQLPDEEVSKRQWEEFGAVTGRRRRIGEFDFDLARRSIMLNGATQLALTNVDRRFEDAAGVRSLEALPPAARAFVDGIEDQLGVPIVFISTGAEVDEHDRPQLMRAVAQSGSRDEKISPAKPRRTRRGTIQILASAVIRLIP